MGATGDVRLKMHFNVQPWVGFLTWNQERDLGLWHAMDGGESNPFDIPPVKYSDRNETWTSQGVYL
jgi:signal peptidase complex subunit 3